MEIKKLNREQALHSAKFLAENMEYIGVVDKNTAQQICINLLEYIKELKKKNEMLRKENGE